MKLQNSSNHCYIHVRTNESKIKTDLHSSTHLLEYVLLFLLRILSLHGYTHTCISSYNTCINKNTRFAPY